jgi:hypothetical protein
MDKTNPEVSSVVYDDLFSSTSSSDDVSSFDDALIAAKALASNKPKKSKKFGLSPADFTSEVKSFEGFKYIKRWVVPFNDIRWDKVPVIGKGARVGGKDDNHIDKLKIKFDKKIRADQPVPILILKAVFDEQTGTTHYVLIDGLHRMDVFEMLDYTEWVFDIYEYDYSSGLTESEATTLIQIKCNDEHLPSRPNSEDDIVMMAIRLLSDPSTTIIDQSEDSIRNFIETRWVHATQRSKNAAVNKVIRKWETLTTNGTQNLPIQRQFVTYNKQDAVRFLDNDGLGFKCSGQFDEVRNEIGYVVTENQEASYIINAMFRYLEEGKKSYFILQTKQPTIVEPLSVKVIKMEEEIKRIENGIKKVAGLKEGADWDFPWRIVGRLPQLPTDVNTMIFVDSENYKP